MADVLPSWNDTPTTQALVEFVEAAARSIPPGERVAVFDNDGTHWCEKPMPVELGFIPARPVRIWSRIGRRPLLAVVVSMRDDWATVFADA